MSRQFIKSTVIAFMLFSTVGGTSASKKITANKSMRIVYICTGPNAKTYHSSKRCGGLNRCSHEIVSIDLNKAKLMGRRACKKCY